MRAACDSDHTKTAARVESRLSVIIPCYNEIGTIDRLIGAVNDSAYRDTEIILIDDGSHIQKHQILTLQMLFPHIKDDGVYICEDLHCSYWKDWGGGYLKPDTFIEFSKKLIDHLNSWHSQNPALPVSPFTKSAHSMHYYDSMLVIEKRVMEKPQNLRIGKPTW